FPDAMFTLDNIDDKKVNQILHSCANGMSDLKEIGFSENWHRFGKRAAVRLGYRFRYPTIDQALQSLEL
ncbi:MAG TPA: DUF1731 domain-containing protein, partial [Candidatus Binatia bacterium]